jgi:hypothetical protein
VKEAVRYAVLFSTLSVLACREIPSNPQQSPAPPPVVKAVYVLNEGNYGDPTGARLSLYDVERDTVYINVFESANNNSQLGSVGDDMKIVGDKAYILMSGSENLNVVSLVDHSLGRTASYPGATPHDLVIDSPRNRAYVTRLFSSSILVLDLSSLAIIDSVRVGANPQGMVLVGDNLFVCNSGYGEARTVSVIDVRADTVRGTLTLADGPTGAAMSPDGKLWVVCTGNAFGTPATRGKIFIVSTSTLAVEDSITFTGNLWGSIAIGVDGYAYVVGVTAGSFYGGPVHRISLVNKSVSLRFVDGTFYGMAVDAVSGDLYLADAKNFSVNGEVLIYTKEGSFRKRFTAQRGPSVITFKR